MRSGTLTCPASSDSQGRRAVSLEMAEESIRVLARRDACARHRTRVSNTIINGSLEHRLPGNLNISFAFVERAMMMALKDVPCRRVSALHVGSLEPSYVYVPRCGRGEWPTPRFGSGLGRFTTEGRGDYVIDCRG